jgi:hypothetical protein
MLELRVSPTSVSHQFAGWRQQWRAIINGGLSIAENICREVYHKYTNPTSGRRIRSRHISQMLKIDRQDITGTPKAADKYKMTAYLSGGEVRGGVSGGAKWEKIAMAQEFGAIIRPKSSRVLAIPNRRLGLTSFSRPTQYKDARWIKRGDKLFLERTPGLKSRPKVSRKPPKVITKKPQVARKARMPATKQFREVLFIGAKQVRLKPRSFFRDSMREAERIIDRRFPEFLKAEMEKII